MAYKKITLPKNLAEFVRGTNNGEIARLEKLVNALQQQKVQIAVSGSNQVAVGTVQISGSSAVISVQL